MLQDSKVKFQTDRIQKVPQIISDSWTVKYAQAGGIRYSDEENDGGRLLQSLV